MNTGVTFDVRYMLLRTLRNGQVVITDTSIDVFNGQAELLDAIDGYLYDDEEGTVYTIIDVKQGKVVAQRRVEVAKRAVRL